MRASAHTLEVKGIGRTTFAGLSRKALRLGMSVEEYVKELVELDVSIADRARRSSFAEIVGPSQEVDEAELDRLVEGAKGRHHQQAKSKKAR